MRVPLSWLKEYVDIDLPCEELAHKLTMAGLEVEEIHYVGVPLPGTDPDGSINKSFRPETKITGLAWDPEKIVVGAIKEVKPHPNADRLVLCQLDDGDREHTVLTGAPNLFPYKGLGLLNRPIKVAYAQEGAQLYDGHKAEPVLMKLKRSTIRGVESYSMACSEKELGISDEHEGIIFLDDDAPVGLPLVDYMGDVVFDIVITPNIARDANVLGVAREVAAITNTELKVPDYEFLASGTPITGLVSIEITDAELNPRFVVGLIRDIQIKPSPYWVQRRLRLSGVRPINNIVDATNYAMLDIGEPLHAFDYDILAERAMGQSPKIITRRAKSGEKLTTLDDIERTLDDFTILVCDQKGPLALAGVMGGAESEVRENTTNILLEGASWNMINTRRTVLAQNLPSEAAYRFSRGVHPAMAERGVRRGLELMRQWSGGTIAKGLVDNYPHPPENPTVDITSNDVQRWLGIQLPPDEIASLLKRLEFDACIDGETVHATAPDHRLDIGKGIIGVSDLLEEIARVYGYNNIPESRLRDELPPQHGNVQMEREERVRDVLVELGLQEVITYRMTSALRESRRLAPNTPPNDNPYVKITNPIVSDRDVLRQSLLASILEVVEQNARLRNRMALFEISPIFLGSEGGDLPDELLRLAIVLIGPRSTSGWQPADSNPMDFFDIKGITDMLLHSVHIDEIRYEPTEHPTFHPGKCARVLIRMDNNSTERQVGVLGELHPQVRGAYDLPTSTSQYPILAGDFDLMAILETIPARFEMQPVPPYPPVLEDLAIVVDENIPAEQVANLMQQTGGNRVVDIRLFDVYRSKQIGSGKKSLAYSLTYQAPDRTLTDKEVAKIRNKLTRRLERELGAYIRSA